MSHSVLLVEDEADTRERLTRAIRSHAGLTLVAEVGTCAEAREHFARCAPDVLLTDLGLPDGHGADLIREASQRHPRLRSMVITVFGDEAHVMDAISAGAAGYLLKDASAHEVGRSIMDLLDGGSPISPGVARYLLKHLRHARKPTPTPGTNPVDELSPRELQVLQLIGDGCRSSEIAAKLHISLSTVATHVAHIHDKLGVNSRARAVLEAGERGLLSRPARRN